MFKRYWHLLALLFALLGGCARIPDIGTTPIRASSLEELQTYLLHEPPRLEQFRLRGPFAVRTRAKQPLRLPSGEVFQMDVYLSSHPDKAPLVLILHGLDSVKEQHQYQAMHLASWGLHTIALQLPNQGPWVENGKTLVKIVDYLRHSAATIDPRIDPSRIILAGHSFGGAATAVALGDGVPVIGAVLLDPAAISKELPNYLRRVQAPVMVIGADEQISEARNRAYFYNFIRGNVAEVSIRDAVHEDAQFPSHSVASSEALQITFMSALTASALSLSATQSLDYAWASFGDSLKSGKLFHPQRK